MRKCILLAVFAVGTSSGCALFGDSKAHCGCRFEILKPPYIDTSMPVLVQSTPGVTQGLPMGISTGPIGGGDYYHQAPPSLVPAPCPPQARPAQVYPARVPMMAPACDSDGPQLTRAQWSQLMRAVQNMPPAEQKPERLPSPGRDSCPQE